MKTKHILLLLVLVVMLVGAFTVSALAGDATKATAQPTYSAIPEEYADAEAYPFAIFKSGTFVTATAKLTGDSDEYAFYYVSTRIQDSETYQILMRRDYTTTTTGTSLSTIIPRTNILFDMNGKTLTLGGSLIYVYAGDPTGKTDRPINITTINGTVAAGANTICQISDYYKNKTYNITFENVNFKNIQGLIATDNISGNDCNDKNHTNFYLYFNNCNFEITNASWFELFNLGYGKTRSINRPVEIYFNGGNIDFASGVNGYFMNIGNNCSSSKKIFFGADANGNYTTIQAKDINKQLRVYDKNGATTEYTLGFVSESGEELKLYDLGVADGSKKTYLVSPELDLTTKYGTITAMYANSAKYPFLIFKNGQFVTGTEKLTGDSIEFAINYVQANAQSGETYQILMRRDYTTASTNTQLGLIAPTSNLILDLDNHTLTLGASLYHIMPNGGGTCDPAKAVNITTKNGTINVGANIFCKISSAWHKKSFNLTFENLKIDNVKDVFITDGIDGMSASDSDDKHANYNVYFNSCDIAFNYSAWNRVFEFGYKGWRALYFPVNIYFNGGSINYLVSRSLVFCDTRNGVQETKKIYFGQDENGKYTTIKTPNKDGQLTWYNKDNGTTNPFTFVSATGEPLYLYANGNNTYTPTPYSFVSTYLNLTNNLNFVYRVCLPAGYTNPVATFTVGEDTVTVTEYTIDENGLYCFTLTAIAPHKMGDLVNASVTATYNGAETTITNNQVSVKNYADALRTQYAEDTKMIALLDALLVYGATSQVYMNYNLDALVAEIGDLSAIPEAPIQLNGETSAIANITACGLMLDGAFDLRVGIQATTLEGLTLEITKGDKTTTVELTEDMKKGNYIAVYYDGLLISELDTEVTFTLKLNGETVGKTLTFSAAAYLYRMQTSENTALANLTKALYAYGTAAKAYNA